MKLFTKIFGNYNWSNFRIVTILLLSALFTQIIDGLLSNETISYTFFQIAVYTLLNILGVIFISFVGVFASTHINFSVLNYPDILQNTLIGFILAFFAILTDFIFFDGIIIKQINSLGGVGSRLATAYSAAIGEEVLFRLCIMSVVILMAKKILKSIDLCIWVAIILSSLLFGLAHIPKVYESISVPIIIRALLLNGIAGVIFGWIFWQRGLISAFLVHFSADFMIYIISPFFLKIADVV